MTPDPLSPRMSFLYAQYLWLLAGVPVAHAVLGRSGSGTTGGCARRFGDLTNLEEISRVSWAGPRLAAWRALRGQPRRR